MGTRRYIETTAKQKLREMFPDPTIGEASPEKILMTLGRNPDEPTSRQWLRDVLSSMREYNFIEKVRQRTPSGADKIILVKLTPAGRNALGYTQSPDNHGGNAVSLERLEQLYREVQRIRELLPSFDVIFKIAPKEEN